jgi:predicted molibdopterin-dependent oxidoreductase YjgC
MNTTTSSQAITVTIDGRTSPFPAGTTVLEAARAMGIAIPTLCAYRGMSPYGACRVCIVELEGPRGSRQIASCSYPVEPNMVVRTETPAIKKSRGIILELLLAQAPESEKLAAFAKELGVEKTSFKKGDSGSCILCGLCVRTCSDVMKRDAIGMFGRGYKRKVRPAFGETSDQCQVCGGCDHVCPTGAIELGKIGTRDVRPNLTAFNQYLEARPNIDMAHPPSTATTACISKPGSAACAPRYARPAQWITIRRRRRARFAWERWS